jgi:hypothetical protein
MPTNFYYNQQDFLEEFQKGKSWTWSVARPHGLRLLHRRADESDAGDRRLCEHQ